MPVEYNERLVVSCGVALSCIGDWPSCSTSSGFPFCRKYTTGIFSGFDCYSEAGEVDPVLPTLIPGYSMLDFSSSESAADVSSHVSAAESGQSVDNNAAITATPFTQTQATGSSGGAASNATEGDGGCASLATERWLAGVLSLWPIFVMFWAFVGS